MAGVLCGQWIGFAAAAPDDATGPRSHEQFKAAPARVEEAQPSLYYLKDKQGNLQAVPNFGFEDFEELYRLKHQLAPGEQRPLYSIQQISASGTAAGGYAELAIQFRILVRDDQWVRVPLRLDQAILRATPECQGPGEQFVHFENEGKGYVAWIHGTAGSQHQISLKTLVPLATVGDQTRWKLLFPRATAAELKFAVPLAGAVAKVSEGATLLPPTRKDGETGLGVLGVSGEFELTWRPGGAHAVEVPTTLEAVGAVASRIDGRGVNAEATLTVKSYGAAFDRFRVRLPRRGTGPGRGDGLYHRDGREERSGRSAAAPGRGAAGEENSRPDRRPSGVRAAVRSDAARPMDRPGGV